MFCEVIFLSTPSARRATSLQREIDTLTEISIHALREEGDKICLYGEWRIPISIHALREEGDITDHSAYLAGAIFLSTPSARRATLADLGCTITSEFLSTPSARRATSESFSAANCTAPFLSTPSARRATGPCSHHGWSAQISIHALREEGDRASVGGFFVCLISIHALREEGDESFRTQRSGPNTFLSTPSARRAT